MRFSIRLNLGSLIIFLCIYINLHVILGQNFSRFNISRCIIHHSLPQILYYRNIILNFSRKEFLALKLNHIEVAQCRVHKSHTYTSNRISNKSTVAEDQIVGTTKDRSSNVREGIGLEPVRDFSQCGLASWGWVELRKLFLGKYDRNQTVHPFPT